MTQIKICGLKPGDDLSFTLHPIVTHIGVMFVPASKRYVQPGDVRALLDSKSPSCTAMGIFVNATESDIVETLTESGIRGAQLHGQESVELCQRLKDHGMTVWKSVSVPPGQVNPDQTIQVLLSNARPFLPHVDGILLDTAPPKSAKVGVTGGHGMTFDWSILPSVFDELRAEASVAIWVAGGLTPENVQDLLDTCAPDGIDVSSGVEVAGRKSAERIHDMIEAVASRG